MVPVTVVCAPPVQGGTVQPIPAQMVCWQRSPVHGGGGIGGIPPVPVEPPCPIIDMPAAPPSPVSGRRSFVSNWQPAAQSRATTIAQIGRIESSSFIKCSKVRGMGHQNTFHHPESEGANARHARADDA